MSITSELSGAVPAVWVEIEKDEQGYWNATSPNLFGLNLCNETQAEVIRYIPAAIKQLMKLNHGLEVEVTPLHSFSASVPGLLMEPDAPNGYAVEADSLREAMAAAS